MGKLRIIIADSDTDYLKSVERFLIVNYPHRFELFSFSSYRRLSDFLTTAVNIDLLIIDSQLYQKNLRIDNVMSVLLLSEDLSEDCTRACFDYPPGQGDEADFALKKPVAIKKYQHMDRFISDIMRIYAANSQKDRRITAAQGNTRIVSIISPSGGTGKSSITAGCSVLCAGRGIRTFYLNLENIPSTNLFFHGDSTQSFSNAIFHLKGRGANLSLKLEGVKSIDTGSNVHYFKPPENIQDLNELTESDLVCLMNELKNSGVYDIIFIDTSAGLSPINTAIIKNSDIILLVMNPNRGSELKLRGLRAGLDLLERKQGIKLTCKIIPVINRVEEKAGKLFLEECDGFLGRCEQPAEIGDYSCRGFSDISSGLLENREFLSELGIVAERLLGLSIAELNFCDGGEHIA